MKKLFLIFIFLSAFVSCGSETTETNKCEGQMCSAHGTCVVENNSAKCNCETGYHSDGLTCIIDITNLCENIICDEWKECNSSTGNCDLKQGKCDTSNDCDVNLICDTNHNCILQNPCEGQTCSAHGTCVVENNSAKCNCETGFVANGLSCEEKLCEEEAGQYVSCGENGEKQHQICTNNQWINDGACLCSNSTTRRITCQGDGLQYQTCVAGTWTDVGQCINTDCSTAGETRAVGCGFNGIGVQNQVCVNSKWTNTATCTDHDICGNGITQLVENNVCEEQSLNGRGKAEQICANGQWIDYEGNCKDPDICEDNTKETIEGICGLNNRGTKYKKCAAGQWDLEYCNDPDLAMDVYEVTAEEFKQCVTAGNCTATNYKTTSQQGSCNLNKVGNENHPMNCVNWFGADEYCQWKGKVLPTEEEWEYAAKGGENYIYSGSDNTDEVAWYDANSGDTTHIVGTKAANGYGLYDMSGNVWEWTNSLWDNEYDWRVLRGGGFHSNGNSIQVAYRDHNTPSNIYDNNGFRCVQSLLKKKF